jgi:hypothetical protein
MAKLTDDELAGFLGQEISQADGWDSDELASNREQALDYYFGRPNAAPSMTGRSSVQSLDVADMHGAVLAAMMPAFEIDDLVSFEPLGEDDIDQARLESSAVNYMVMQENDGYMMFKESIHDALLLRNGLVKVWLDELENITREQYEGLTDLEVYNAKDRPANVDFTITKEEKRPDGLIDLSIKYTEHVSKLRVTSIDPTEFIWSLNHDSIFLQGVKFCAERTYPTRSDLIEMGYDKALVDDLAHTSMDTKNDSNARNRDNSDSAWKSQQKAQDVIEMFDCYYRVDMDGDGVAELRNIYYASGSRKILANDPIDFVPYASGTAWLNPHRFSGVSMFDRMQTVQDAKTRILRQWLDNQNAANNARLGVVTNLVDMDDVLNSRPGGVIRMDSPDAIVPIPSPDIGASAASALGYLDTVRSERGGASLDLQTQGQNLIGDSGVGIERQFSSREQQTADMLRTLSETLVKETYKLVHTAMRTWLPGNIQFNARGNFQTANPQEWQARERVNVQTGLSSAERLARKSTLEQIILQQKEFISQGQAGVITDQTKVHNAILDWSLFSGVDNPERYWLDPASEEAQAAQQRNAQGAQEQEQKMDKLATDAITVPAQLQGAKILEDARQFDDELDFKYTEAGIKAETEEAKIVGNAALELEKGALKLVEDRQEAALDD